MGCRTYKLWSPPPRSARGQGDTEWRSQRQRQLGKRGKGEPVMSSRAECLDAFLVLLSAVPHVRVPAITWVPGGKPMHEKIANRLGKDGGGRNRLAARIAVHQGLVGITDLRQRQAIDENPVGAAQGGAE